MKNYLYYKKKVHEMLNIVCTAAVKKVHDDFWLTRYKGWNTMQQRWTWYALKIRKVIICTNKGLGVNRNLLTWPGSLMVCRLDCCSFDYAHTWSKSGFSICWRHLVTSKESSNRVFLPVKTHFPSCVRNVKWATI